MGFATGFMRLLMSRRQGTVKPLGGNFSERLPYRVQWLRAGYGVTRSVRLHRGHFGFVERRDVAESGEASLRQRAISLSGSWYSNLTTLPAQVLSGVGTYTDRPTVTYSPLIGERFARSLMSPIPPSAIVSLIQAGYPADFVLQLTLHSINNMQNHFGGEARAKPADAGFYRLIELMRRMQ
ncbi:MAG: hypothetical protein PHF31_09345, partial [Methylobacter sp.]|nr:hypothetical protein [Methylobacter sp.]